MTRNLIKLGALKAKQTAFLLCDIQETFRPNIKHFVETVNVANKMLEAAKHLNIPVYVSEYFPKSHGYTVKELNLDGATLVYVKETLSMYNQELKERLKNDVPDLETVVISGLAAHLCVEETVIDLLREDVIVHVLADGVSARSLLDRSLALKRFQSMGCFVGTAENVLFKLLKDKNHPAFKQISKLMAKPTSDVFGAH